MLVDVPGWLDDAAKLAQTESPAPDLRAKLIRRLKLSLREAYKWQWRGQATKTIPVWKVDREELPHGKEVEELRPLYEVYALHTIGHTLALRTPRRHGSIKMSRSQSM